MPIQNFTITHINKRKLQQPMEFVFIEVQKHKLKGISGDFFFNKREPLGVERSFFLCAFPCSQEFWEFTIKGNTDEIPLQPSKNKYPTRPVENISWLLVKQFLALLNYLWLTPDYYTLKENIQKPKGRFDLPLEMQWEFAARGGMEEQRYLFAGSNHLDDVGWYNNNANIQTMPIGLKQPNSMGLYDMSGNVWEWCRNEYNKMGSDVEYSLSVSDAYKAIRGGSSMSKSRNCTVFHSNGHHPTSYFNDVGFRLFFSQV